MTLNISRSKVNWFTVGLVTALFFWGLVMTSLYSTVSDKVLVVRVLNNKTVALREDSLKNRDDTDVTNFLGHYISLINNFNHQNFSSQMQKSLDLIDTESSSGQELLQRKLNEMNETLPIIEKRKMVQTAFISDPEELDKSKHVYRFKVNISVTENGKPFDRTNLHTLTIIPTLRTISNPHGYKVVAESISRGY